MIDILEANLASVRERIDAATKRSGRLPGDVKLIGVTKYVDVDTTRQLADAGCDHLGESRPQVLWEKADVLSNLPIQWHMIGHVQRNKVKRTVACSDLIHSVDSHRLLTAIDVAGRESETVVNVLLEVNVSMETAKHGFTPEDLPAALDFVSNLKYVSVRGLMCMAGLNGSIDDARREFALLRELKERLESGSPENADLKELSMGMSGDFEVAVEQGATMVRIGSLLLEGI